MVPWCHVGAHPASCTSAQSANGLASRDLESGSLGPWRTHPDVFRKKSDSKNGTIWGGKQWIWVINHYHPLSSIYSCKFDQFEGETNEFWWCPTFFWRLIHSFSGDFSWVQPRAPDADAVVPRTTVINASICGIGSPKSQQIPSGYD